MAVIEVNNLTKDYGHGRGVYNVSFQINKGEVFGFLGPNGAGKTTTIRHLMGFSNSQSGSCLINGMKCNKYAGEIMKDVGYLPGEVALPENLSGNEFIHMMQDLRGSYNEQRLKYLLDKFKLDPRGKTKRMSLGNKRKLAIVTAFMADPDILILDEPTSGLDPVMQEEFIDFMREEKERGKTILLSSHIFTEVDAVCDRISIIKDGRIVSTVNTDEIHHNHHKTFQISFANKKNMQDFINLTHFEIVSVDQFAHYATVKTTDNEINTLIRSLVHHNVISLKEEKFTLSNYFLHFYEEEQQPERIII